MTKRDEGELSDAEQRAWAEVAARAAQASGVVKSNVIDLDHRRRETELDAILRTARSLKTYGAVLPCVRLMYGHRLAYNEMIETEELDGRPFRDADYGRLCEDIETRRGVAPSDALIKRAVCQVCDERRYHPVRIYLNDLRAWDGVARWRLIPHKLFGHPEPRIPEAPALEEIALERFAIAAIARVMSPGCQVDTVLILQGDQGFKKTTFFRSLAGIWHGEGAMDIHNNKAPLLLAASWIWVWDELTTIMRGREEVAVKDFVTRLKDVMVKPYGRHAIKKQRSCVIAGTTNATEILTDPTGDRRWWIVRVLKRIDHQWLIDHRDQLWAEALHYYRNKSQWHMTDDEEEQRSEAASEWRAPEAWLEPVATWTRSLDAMRLLATNGWLTSNDVAAGLGVPIERRDKSVMTRIGLTMGQLRWEERRRTLGGAKVREYRPRAASTT